MYRVEIRYSRDFAFKVKTANFECVIDAQTEGLRPSDCLLASLGSCIGVYLRKHAQTAKLALANFTIIVEAEFSKISPTSFKTINVFIDLGGSGISLDERRKKALLRFIKNCPIHATLKGNPAVEMKLS